MRLRIHHSIVHFVWNDFRAPLGNGVQSHSMPRVVSLHECTGTSCSGGGFLNVLGKVASVNSKGVLSSSVLGDGSAKVSVCSISRMHFWRRTSLLRSTVTDAVAGVSTTQRMPSQLEEAVGRRAPRWFFGGDAFRRSASRDFAAARPRAAATEAATTRRIVAFADSQLPTFRKIPLAIRSARSGTSLQPTEARYSAVRSSESQ